MRKLKKEHDTNHTLVVNMIIAGKEEHKKSKRCNVIGKSIYTALLGWKACDLLMYPLFQRD